MTYCKENESLTERILRIAIITIVILSMVVPIVSPRVFAASSVTISGGDSVKGGDTFTVAVTFGGGSVGRVDGQLTYDTDKLTYISGGSSSGNSGYIQLKSAGTDGSITFNIQFQAIAEGNTVLEVTTNDMYDLDERSMDTVSGSKTISISGSAASDEIIAQTTSPDQPVEETELIGVDEKTDDSDGNLNINMILIIIAAVLVILIVVIAVALKKKKASGKAGNESKAAELDEAAEGSDNGAFREETEGNGIDDKSVRKEAKKRANEETALWNDWKGMDDDDKRRY